MFVHICVGIRSGGRFTIIICNYFECIWHIYCGITNDIQIIIIWITIIIVMNIDGGGICDVGDCFGACKKQWEKNGRERIGKSIDLLKFTCKTVIKMAQQRHKKGIYSGSKFHECELN